MEGILDFFQAEKLESLTTDRQHSKKDWTERIEKIILQNKIKRSSSHWLFERQDKQASFMHM